MEELADKHHLLKQFEDDLRQMYTSFPKNEHGNLGHQAVRSVLHRFFVNRHGWYFRGLDSGITVAEDQPVGDLDKDRIAELLQETFEKLEPGRGADLRGLAALAVSLEDLVQKETQAHLVDAYAAVGAQKEANLTAPQAEEALQTYFMSFLLEHNWTVEGSVDLAAKKAIFAERYPLYTQALEWFHKVTGEVVQNNSQSVDFNQSLTAASKIGEEYHQLNDNECTDLRTTLQQMESRRAGRIRLSVFYNMSLHSHWKFNENVDTLRLLGALDESDPKQMSVIIPNYAMARPNCVNASNLYEICCPDTCMGIMGSLEKEIGTSTASVQRIAGLMAKFPAGELPQALLDRLQEIAEHHGGEVPLHGRLFAQFLHHVYPLECPYPHESGTTNPQSWTGQDSEQATEAEMRKHVEADSCAVDWQGKMDCGEESTALPWNPTEELLSFDASFPNSRHNTQSSRGGQVGFMMAGVLGVCAFVVMMLSRSKRGALSKKLAVLAFLLMTSAAYCAGLLDGAVLRIAVVGGVFSQLIAPRFASMSGDCQGLPIQAKHV